MLIHLSVWYIQNMLHHWSQERHSQFWEEESMRQDSENSGTSFGRLPYQLWNVSKYGSCADAAITGIMPPPLVEVQVFSCDKLHIFLFPYS